MVHATLLPTCIYLLIDKDGLYLLNYWQGWALSSSLLMASAVKKSSCVSVSPTLQSTSEFSSHIKLQNLNTFVCHCNNFLFLVYSKGEIYLHFIPSINLFNDYANVGRLRVKWSEDYWLFLDLLTLIFRITCKNNNSK